MDYGVIVTAVIGIITSFISAWTSWFFTRKKYNTEVSNNIIKNMEESLEFYKNLSDDNKKRLDATIKRNDELEDEIRELRKLVNSLMIYACKDMSCKLRQINITENEGDNNGV